ncbi:MAG: proton-conducting transporter membrane subunit [Planctomycetota bacterium]
MNFLVVSPILIPILTAMLCMTLWGRLRVQRVLSLVGAVALLACSVTLLVLVDRNGAAVSQAGGWAAPFGISFVADRLSAIMVSLVGLCAVAVIVYAIGSLDHRRESMGFHALAHAMLSACSGAFLAGDMFNVYVWFEVMLLSSFVLLTLGGERGQLEGAIKYVALNLLSSTIFLTALGILYGIVGSLNMADIGLRIRSASDPSDIAMLTALSMLFLTSFGVKAAAFPFFFWLPASYHTPPPAISALFAGLLTKVGAYMLIRVFTVVFTTDQGIVGPTIAVMAALTMLVGVLGALAQKEMRRILSFMVIGPIGFILMGLGVAITATARADALAETLGAGVGEVLALRTAAALALGGSVFYLLHDIVVKTNLFLIAGVVLKIKGCAEVDKIGGLYRSHPKLALLFMIPALSLAGFPILSGFWPKLALVRGGLQAEAFGVVAVALVASLLTILVVLRLWAEVFWKNQPEPVQGDFCAMGFSGAGRPFRKPLMYAPIAGLAAVTLTIGLGAGPIWGLAQRAANDLLHPAPYTYAVLGDEGLERLDALGVPEHPRTRLTSAPIDADLHAEGHHP